jgi:hypothetical protein
MCPRGSRGEPFGESPAVLFSIRNRPDVVVTRCLWRALGLHSSTPCRCTTQPFGEAVTDLDSSAHMTTMSQNANVMEWVRSTRAVQGMPAVIEDRGAASRVLAAVDRAAAVVAA